MLAGAQQTCLADKIVCLALCNSHIACWYVILQAACSTDMHCIQLASAREGNQVVMVKACLYTVR